MNDTNNSPTWYLWAAPDSPSALPGRLAVVVCDRCGAVVAATASEPHTSWHDRRDER